jgi:hypothetical protein
LLKGDEDGSEVTTFELEQGPVLVEG